MSIGNFKSKGPTAKSPTPSKTVVDAVEKTLEKDIADTSEVLEKALSYEDILKEEGITLEEARKIKDAILIEDVYRETTDLTPNVSVTFRTRVYQDIVRFHQELERYQPKFVTERNEISMRYFLAASLEAFKGRAFEHPHPTKDATKARIAFDERHEYILNLPEPVVQRLCSILHKFDRKVALIFSDGAVESF